MNETESTHAAWAQLPERNTADNVLRTAQQHHMQLSAMADTKANIIITVSSIVLTLSMGKLSDPSLRVAVLILTAFTLGALLLAILAVLPKYRPLKLDSEVLPPHFNLLFFGHFSEISRERFLDEIAQLLQPDGAIYRTQANDLYSIGVYLARHKYRYLRMSYIFFLAGFFFACGEQAIRLLLA